MTAQEQKNLILNAMREIFPSILPSRLQEARQAVLTHMGMTHEDFGFYPSGQPKYDNLCSQAVKTLKSTGEMTTQGWEWRWVGKVPSTPPMKMDMTMELFDLSIEITPSTPSLYDLGCEETVIRLVATTDCFGKVVQSDEMCQGCPLFDLCIDKKGEVKQAKREAREARNEALEIASNAGYDLSQVKVPKSAKLHEAREIEALADTSCIVSGEPIVKGETAFHIPSWGMVKKAIGESYMAMENP